MLCGGLRLVSGGLRLVSGGLRWFAVISRTGKLPLFFTETNSRYFIGRAIARTIIIREFVAVKKGTFYRTLLFSLLY